jgi:hypothetical protein
LLRTIPPWLPSLLLAWLRPRRHVRTLWIAVCDHFEPLWRRADGEQAAERVTLWRRQWPAIAARHIDSAGRPPQYTFFYPEEEYRPEFLEPLADMTRSGVADVEVHLHHDRDTADGFRERVSHFVDVLARNHGLLRTSAGKPAFGFIHGNWALDNARPDGRWCGLNNEITLLKELGCYADFTLPAAPDPSQAGPVNEIYDVTDDPDRPRSHARGVPVRRGTARQDLTLITGPLGITFAGRRRLRPYLETGELAHYARPTPRRVSSWLSLAPRIQGHGFVKLFAHGAQEANSAALLGGGLDEMFSGLAAVCRARSIELRFVTAWEMWRVVEDLRAGAVPLTRAG